MFRWKIEWVLGLLVGLVTMGGVPVANGQVLPSGGSVSAAIDFAGDIDTYTFDASLGDSAVLSVSGEISMFMTLFGPGGGVIDTTTSTITRNPLTETGTYTVTIQSNTANNVGAYAVHFARLPGANEGGALTDSDLRAADVTAGDIDTYTFDAAVGDSAILSVSGSIAFFMSLYGPNGALIDTSTSTITRNVFDQAGTYTVVVRSNSAHNTGIYDLHFALVPGANEGGALGSTDFRPEDLTSGDLDTFTFGASMGDSALVSASGSIALLLSLYGPDGALIDSSTSRITRNVLDQTGTYTVVVRSNSAHNAGTYDLHFALVPGANEGGALDIWDLRATDLTSGDIDTYTFDASVGDAALLSVSGSISLLMSLYGPDGALIDTSTSRITRNGLDQAGTYTVAVQSNAANNAGTYDLHFALVPGANEGGTLAAADVRSEDLTPGDIDTYTFDAAVDDAVALSVSGSIAVVMSLYGPSGTLLDTSTSTITDASLTPAGTYTVVVRSNSAHTAGTYVLNASRTPATRECEGDVNLDANVDLSDLAIVLSQFGETGIFAGDADLDGDVDLSDLATVLGRFGEICP